MTNDMFGIEGISRLQRWLDLVASVTWGVAPGFCIARFQRFGVWDSIRHRRQAVVVSCLHEGRVEVSQKRFAQRAVLRSSGPR